MSVLLLWRLCDYIVTNSFNGRPNLQTFYFFKTYLNLAKKEYAKSKQPTYSPAHLEKSPFVFDSKFGTQPIFSYTFQSRVLIRNNKIRSLTTFSRVFRSVFFMIGAKFEMKIIRLHTCQSKVLINDKMFRSPTTFSCTFRSRSFIINGKFEGKFFII